MTTQTATTQRVTYRRTQRGEWVAYGPADAIRPDTEVVITKRSGETQRVWIRSVGRVFHVNGQPMVYGYIGQRPATGRCPVNPQYCDDCTTPEQHRAKQERIAAELAATKPQRRLTGRCRSCRCHREPHAGQPGTILYDGCDYCGCQAA